MSSFLAKQSYSPPEVDGFGYITITAPHTPYSIYVGGTITLNPIPYVNILYSIYLRGTICDGGSLAAPKEPEPAIPEALGTSGHQQ